MYDDVYYKKTPCEICKNEKCGLHGKRNKNFDKNNKCNNFTERQNGKKKKDQDTRNYQEDDFDDFDYYASTNSGGGIWTK